MLFYVIYGCTLVALIIFCFAEDIPPGTFNTVIVKHKCLRVVLSVIHISLELFMDHLAIRPLLFSIIVFRLFF